MTRFVRQRRLRSEYALPDIVKPLHAIVTEKIGNFCGKFAVAVDQRSFDFDPRHGCRQIRRKFLRRRIQFLPECRQSWFRCIGKYCKRSTKGLHSLASRGDYRANSDAAQTAFKRLDINAYATSFSCVCHRQRNQQREFEFHELLYQVQTLVEVRGVNDRKDPYWSVYAGYASQYDVGCDAFFERMHAELQR
jgi:hypothetical protein